MFLSKVVFFMSLLFLVVACSGSSYHGTSPVTSSNIAFYKGRYSVSLLVSKNIYDMYINYDGSVKYKLSTDESYKTVSKSSVKYNSENKVFSLPFDVSKGNTFEIMFKDKNNMNVFILEKDDKVSDVGQGKKS